MLGAVVTVLRWEEGGGMQDGGGGCMVREMLAAFRSYLEDKCTITLDSWTCSLPSRRLG